MRLYVAFHYFQNTVAWETGASADFISVVYRSSRSSLVYIRGLDLTVKWIAWLAFCHGKNIFVRQWENWQKLSKGCLHDKS
jgi:hypothetical protein